MTKIIHRLLAIDVSDKWAVSFHNIKLGDLGWCIASLQAEFSLLYHDDGEDE